MLISRSKWLGAVASIVVAGALSTSCSAGGVRASQWPPPQPLVGDARARFEGVLAGTQDPYPDGISTTLDAITYYAGPVLLPDDVSASSACVTTVWEQPSDPSQLAVVFDTNIVLYLVYPALPHDYASESTDSIYGALARTEKVQGTTALVIEGEGKGGGNPGSVSFDLDGANVSIYGYYPSDDLLPVAESVGQYQPGKAPVPCVAPTDSLPPP